MKRRATLGVGVLTAFIVVGGLADLAKGQNFQCQIQYGDPQYLALMLGDPVFDFPEFEPEKLEEEAEEISDRGGADPEGKICKLFNRYRERLRIGPVDRACDTARLVAGACEIFGLTGALPIVTICADGFRLSVDHLREVCPKPH